MFFYIQTRNFFLRGNPQADGVLNYFENDYHGQRHPNNHCGHSQQLDSQQAEAAAQEQACGLRTGSIGKKPHTNRAKRAVQTVDAHSTHRVIHFQHLIDPFNACLLYTSRCV